MEENQTDSKEWQKEIEELINSFTGSDNKRGRCPGSRKEINNAKNIIEKYRVAALKDDELNGALNDIGAKIKASLKLRYIGTIWIPLLADAFIIFFFYHMGLKQYFTDLEIGSIETVQKVLDSEIKDIKVDLDRARTSYGDAMRRGKEKKAENAKARVEKAEEELAKHESMTAESYIEYRKQKWDDEGTKGMRIWGLKFLMFVLFVYFSFIPAFELYRRGGKDRDGSGFMGFIGRLFDSLITMQPRIITTHDGYGHKRTSEDHSGSYLAIFLPVIITVFVIFVIVFFLLPFMLFFAFVRNFLIPKFY